MAGKKIGYIRVSTPDQRKDRQLAGLDLDQVFEDHASGKGAKRPQLEAMLAYVRDGDVIHVHSLDRLTCNLVDLRWIVAGLVERGIAIHFHAEGLVFSPDQAVSPMSTLMLSMLGAVAEFERSLIRERQREGIAAAKNRGVYRGRRPSLTPDQITEVRQLVAGGIPKAELASRYAVSRETIYQALKHPA